MRDEDYGETDTCWDAAYDEFRPCEDIDEYDDSIGYDDDEDEWYDDEDEDENGSTW